MKARPVLASGSQSTTQLSTLTARVVARCVAWGAVVLTIPVLFVRMAPDDALGALAALWHVPVALVLLALAALLFGGMALIRRVTPPSRLDRAVGITCLVLGVVTAVLGVFSI